MNIVERYRFWSRLVENGIYVMYGKNQTTTGKYIGLFNRNAGEVHAFKGPYPDDSLTLVPYTHLNKVFRIK